MLNEDSIPVWMLADSLLALMASGALACVAVLPMDLLNAPLQSSHRMQDFADTRTALVEATSSLLDAAAEQQNLRSEIQIQRNISADQKATIHQLNETIMFQRTEVEVLKERLIEIQESNTREKSVRQELLGLKGSMERTLFVIDISASMANEFTGDYVRANWQPGENAWNNVKRKVEYYLELLPVTSFRIVCFNHDIFEFPLESKAWSTDRASGLRFLNSLRPSGITGTELALLKAFEHDPTSVILFTDGQPTRSIRIKDSSGNETDSSEFDAEQQMRILRMPVSGIAKCPINVIALNDYTSMPAVAHDKNSAGLPLLMFLQELAGRSGGAFLGY